MMALIENYQQALEKILQKIASNIYHKRTT
jgi:hypothetical protein